MCTGVIKIHIYRKRRAECSRCESVGRHLGRRCDWAFFFHRMYYWLPTVTWHFRKTIWCRRLNSVLTEEVWSGSRMKLRHIWCTLFSIFGMRRFRCGLVNVDKWSVPHGLRILYLEIFVCGIFLGAMSTARSMLMFWKLTNSCGI